MPSISLTDLVTAVKSKAAELDAFVYSGADITVSQFASMQTAKSGQITFLANPKYGNQILDCEASAIVVDEANWQKHKNACQIEGVIVSSNPYAFFAFASQVIERLASQQTAPSHHPSAIIDSTATIETGVQIGAYCVVGVGAKIGANCILGSHVVVSDYAAIGERTQLYSHVTVYHGVQIGRNCIVHSGSVLGADGFGFAPYQKRWVKIPQTGTLIIGDDVEIGANCTLDRGALGNTVIGRGTKLDNLIQIAHNVQVGEDCAFAANIAIAGSALIGNRVQMGGKAGVLGHLTVCDDVVISSCTLVTKSISKPGFYSGVYPFQENAAWEKNAVSLKRLNQLREQVKTLEKQIANNGSL